MRSTTRIEKVVGEEGPRKYRPVMFVIFLALGFSIFAVPNYIAGASRDLYEVGLAVFLSLLWLVVRKTARLAKFASIMFSFVIASVAYSSTYLVAHPYSLESSVEGIAYQKVLDTAAVVVPIIVLTLASGANLDSIMLKKGKLKLGLLVGTATFLIFLVTSVPVSSLLFYGTGLTTSRVVGWTPWILLFIIPTGIREELLFRGLFLRKYQSLLGPSSSNFLQALIFSSAHLGSTYTPALAIFLVITFLLGLGFGELMKRTNSLLGSVLFHAGADIPIVLGYFSMVS